MENQTQEGGISTVCKQIQIINEVKVHLIKLKKREYH